MDAAVDLHKFSAVKRNYDFFLSLRYAAQYEGTVEVNSQKNHVTVSVPQNFMHPEELQPGIYEFSTPWNLPNKDKPAYGWLKHNNAEKYWVKISLN